MYPARTYLGSHLQPPDSTMAYSDTWPLNTITRGLALLACNNDHIAAVGLIFQPQEPSHPDLDCALPVWAEEVGAISPCQRSS